MTPRTCQRALLSPAGAASRSPASSARPLTRNASITNSEKAFPAGVSLAMACNLSRRPVRRPRDAGAEGTSGGRRDAALVEGQGAPVLHELAVGLAHVGRQGGEPDEV